MTNTTNAEGASLQRLLSETKADISSQERLIEQQEQQVSESRNRLACLKRKRVELENTVFDLEQRQRTNQWFSILDDANQWDDFVTRYNSTNFCNDMGYLRDYGCSDEDVDRISAYLHLTEPELRLCFDFAKTHGMVVEEVEDEVVINFSYEGEWDDVRPVQKNLRSLAVSNLSTCEGYIGSRHFCDFYLRRRGPPLSRECVIAFVRRVHSTP